MKTFLNIFSGMAAALASAFDYIDYSLIFTSTFSIVKAALIGAAGAYGALKMTKWHNSKHGLNKNTK